MTTLIPASLSDAALIAATMRAAGAERRATADLVALLAEVDARRLYLGQGYSSLFTWCTGVLRLSEPAAYTRITAARAARRYPMIFTGLADAELTLTTVTLLAAHLTDENHEALLHAARHRSKRDVERLVASLVPQPDIASSLRRVPSAPAWKSARVMDEGAPAIAGHTDTADSLARLEPPSPKAAPEPIVERTAPPPQLAAPPQPAVAPHPAPAPHPARASRAVLAPLAADRHLLKITLSAEARVRLDRARDLLRHALPSGDPALIVERALTLLVEQLEHARHAAVRRPQARPRVAASQRHVPAAVRRVVWTRDEGRCAFVGTDGRCRETGWLEFHHVVPFARGGPTTADNLELRCRAHNSYEAERAFGARGPVDGARAPRSMATLSGQSSAGGASG